jgi:general secretion pathway protein M
MIKLNREQAIALGVLVLLVVGSIGTAAVSLVWRADAQQELSDRRDALAQLEARRAAGGDGKGRTVAALAPATAFLDAPTLGLAGAQLQDHLAKVAALEQATMISSGIEAAGREDAADTIRVQATFDIHLQALQSILYRLEAGTPYTFVEALSVQPSSVTAQRGSLDPLLRVTVRLRANWRKASA